MKKRAIKIIVALVIYIIAIAGNFGNIWIKDALFIISYLIVGFSILKKAIRNIFRGKVFDENFLMSVATLGAFGVGEFPEAVAVMLFYQIGELFQSYAVDKSRKSISSLMDIRPDYANVLRDGKEIDLTVTRKKITVEHVSSKMVENNIAYLQVDSFDSGVAESFKKQVTELVNKGAKGIIIDLRSNGGGIVSEATGIADLFLKKDETILITKSKIANEQLTVSKNDAIITDIPVVILVNEGTASASEILAGALKDKYPNTTIVGMKTYGKGVIQTLYSLSDGSGLKITTEEYYTPNHNKINKEGITPDVKVDLTKNAEGKYETEFDKDAQVKKAIETIKTKIK